MSDQSSEPTTREQMRIEIASLRAEVARLKDLINIDRTGLAKGLVSVLGTVRGYGWLSDPECAWGSYQWHERTEKCFRDEVGRCFEEIEAEATQSLRESGRRAFEAFHGLNRKVSAAVLNLPVAKSSS